MIELLISLGKLAVGFLCIAGPVVVLLMWLRTRDRRVAMLSSAALRELNLPELRGLFAVKIKSSFFSGGLVAVDLWNCSRDQLWDVLQRLSARLPSHVRVEVNGISDSRTKSTWTVTVKRNPSCIACCP
ncbi:MAG: hypothetical protein ACM3KE_04815 [Hyphomicrobiales bacterium]